MQALPTVGMQGRRDELFGGKRDVETGGMGGVPPAEAKLDEADHVQDKTEEAYKVRKYICVLCPIPDLSDPQ